MISKEQLQTKLKINKQVPALEQSYFRGFKSYNIYYKAQTIKNKDLNMILLRSYQTDIAIYNTVTDILYLRLEDYNCSKTTTEQLNHFLSVTVKSNNYYHETVKKMYLNENEFNELTDIFYKETDFIKYLELEKNYLKRYFKLHQKLYDVQREIKDKYKFYYSFPWRFETPNKTETIKLKTRIKTLNYYEYDELKIIEILTYNKTKNKKLLSVKLKIISETCLIFDNRKQTDKYLYDGYDAGIANNKALTFKRW